MSPRRPWLAHLVPADDREVVDDLAELAAAREGSRLRARWWLWRQVVAFALAVRLDRARPQHLPDPRPGEGLMAAHLFRELGLAVRNLVRRPGFSLPVVVILAAGIGPAVAIFSVVNAVLLRPLPYDDIDRLGLVRIDLSGLTAHPGIAQAEVLDLRTEVGAFAQVEAFARERDVVLGAEEDSLEFVKMLAVTPDLFPMLGIHPLVGRHFDARDLADDAVPAVLLGHALWQSRFGADPELVGETIVLNGNPHLVAGVMPAQARLHLGPGASQSSDLGIWSVLDLNPESRNFWGFRTLVKLAPGVTFPQARQSLAQAGERIVAAYPDVYDSSEIRFDVHPLHDDLVAPVRPAILVLLGAVACVLLIACNNAAGLLLARTVTRTKELAVRRALGAGRGRVMVQVVTEALVLALAAGGLGVAIAHFGLEALLAYQPGNLPRVEEIGLDGVVLGAALATTLVACVAFAAIPAWLGAAADPADSLRQDGRGGGRLRAGARSALLVAQVAFAVVLLVGAGLLIRTVRELATIDLGFDTEGVLTLKAPLDTSLNQGAEGRMAAYGRALGEIGSLPGVTHVGVLPYTPLDGTGFRASYSTDLDSTGEWSGVSADYRWAFPGTLDALGVQLLAGRDLEPADLEQERAVVVVDHTLAAELWPGQNAIGQRLRIGVETSIDDGIVEVVGVMRHPRIVEVRREVRPQIWLPYSALPGANMTLMVRTAGDPLLLAPAVREAVARAGTGRPIHTVRPLAAIEREARADTHFVFLLLSSLSAIALLLSAAGIYSVLAYLVRQRQHETGIRLALGARGTDILQLNVGYGLRLTTIGLGLGLAGALALGRFLESVLFEVTPTDPITFVGVALTVAVAATAASWLPAHRASRLDPAKALHVD